MDRIALFSDQQASIAISFSRKGKTVVEVGDTIAVSSSAGSVLTASFNPVTGLIDVIPIDNVVGVADVTVITTLADGVQLPPQVVGFEVRHPDADALVLAVGAVVDKAASVPNPVANPSPVVVVTDPPPPPPAPPETTATITVT